MTLWDLKRQMTGRILSFDSSMPEAYALRLRELGFDKNVPIICQRMTAFNGPRTFQLGDSVFSLEVEIGKLVEIESGANS